MAKSSSSSPRFVAANLSKSSDHTLSPSPSSFSPAGTSSSGLNNRARLPSTHGRMVLLSRPGRSQPSATSTSRTSKLVVPRPMNLPSLRKEHAGNDRAVTLVTPTGSCGWAKQQGDSAAAPPSTPADLNSASTVSEAPLNSHGGVAPSRGEHLKQSTPSYIAPLGGSTAFSPTRNGIAGSLMSSAHPHHSESGAIIKGDDFPTLQAAVRPLASPSLQCQREMHPHPRQRDRQQEIEDQHSKLQHLSLKQRSADSKQVEYDTGSRLNHTRTVQAQATPKQHFGVDGGRPFETRGVTDNTCRGAYGPSPLIRLAHTSNWTDDERETLQGVHQQGSMRFDWSESNRSRNIRPNYDGWVSGRESAIESVHVSSKYESNTGLARDSRYQDRNVDFLLVGQSRRDARFSNAIAKGLQSDHLEVALHEGAGNWSKGPGRSELFKPDLGLPATERSYSSDARHGNVYSKPFDSRNMDSVRESRVTLTSDRAVREHNGDSHDGSNKEENFSSRHGTDTWQVEMPKKDGGSNQLGRFYPGSGRMQVRARNNLQGSDRGWERRTATVYRQDPFLDDSMSSKGSPSIILEALMGMSGLEAKTLRRKKSELQNFHDPARELFEAELERVQRMQEQERQRMAEERERAAELAKKEEEERERRVIEEEQMHRKLEEEAREAAAKARRKEEEAARKGEELRRAKEDEKQKVILEEERRKEAARRKLLELEERIAKRGAIQQLRGYSEREPSIGSMERATTQDALTVLECTFLRKEPTRKAGVERSMCPPADSRGGDTISGGRERVVQMKRNTTVVEDSPGLSMGLGKHNLREEFPVEDNEQDTRGFSSHNSNTRAQRSSPRGAPQGHSFTHAQERVQAGRLTQLEEGWRASQGEGFGRSWSLGMNAGHTGAGIEGDDDWWGRDDRQPSAGRLRQSLPKQPRVPPPIFRWQTTERQTVHSEITQVASSAHHSRMVDSSHEEHDNAHCQEVSLDPRKDKVECEDSLPKDVQAMEKTCSNTSKEEVLKLSDRISEKGSAINSGASQDLISRPDEIDEFPDLDESIEQLSDVTEAEERLEEVGSRVDFGVHVDRKEESRNDERRWPFKQKAEALGEAVCVDELQDGVVDGLQKQEWNSQRVDGSEGGNQKHARETEEVDEATWESPHTEEVRDGAVDDIDSSLPTKESHDEVFERQDVTAAKDSTTQGAVQDDVVQSQDDKSSATTMEELVLQGQTHLQGYGQSFGQHFQQPFSFMAIPLPHSTPLSGGTPRPPTLSSIQSQQELPYYLHNPLQIGLFPCTPLLPNAIQIGSIQMPLDVHPQVAPSAQLQHQQPPVFQVGQICHLSQPLPPFQSAVDMHPAVAQPLLPQHRVELSLMMDGSQGLPKGDEVLKKSNMSEQNSHDISSVLDAFGDNPVDINLSMGSSSSLTGQVHGNLSVVSNGEVQTSLMGQNATSLARGDIVSDVKNEASVGKITGARRRDNIVCTSGTYGRGTKIAVKKNPDRSDKDSTMRALQETTAKGGGGWMFGHNHGQAEYEVRKPAASEGKVELGIGQGKQGMDVDVTGGLKSTGRPSARSKGNVKVGLPQQTGLVSVTKQAGIEPLLNKDGFIEVRSKRQMLGEQRENCDKTKSKELKVREQVERKQQKLLGNAGTPENSGVLALGQLVSKWCPLTNAKKSVNEVNQVNASYGSGVQERRASPSSKICSSNNSDKASNSGQFQPVVTTNDMDTKRGQPVGRKYGRDDTDGTRMMTPTWGKQHSSHKVVSLTQIQLEAATKPFRFDSLPSQTACGPESGVAFMESKTVHASSSEENVTMPAKASVMPGPIGSLLAGKKIPFGAVTSPTILSSSSHPPSPSFIGAVGLRMETDMGDLSCYSSSHARSYFGREDNGGFTHGKVEIPADDDLHEKLEDAEAEAEAAASAIAAAAISNDEGHPDVNTPLGDKTPSGTYSFFPSSGLQETRGGADDGIAVALPPDLSVEAPAPFVQSPLSNHISSSGLAVQPLPSRASPFPFMEMGTFASGPFFSYRSPGDTSMGSIEPGLGTLGTGGAAGWQQRHPSTSDSFYGGPPLYKSSGGLSGIQGHPQMLVYTNPFTPIGQFGQVSFLGTAYQPDWTNAPFGTPGESLGQHEGELNSGVPVMMDSQQSGVCSNVQPFSVPVCSMLPVPADPSFPGPFQTHWSRDPAPPFASYHVSRLAAPIAASLNFQSGNIALLPSEPVGPAFQSSHVNDGSHRVCEESNSHKAEDLAQL